MNKYFEKLDESRMWLRHYESQVELIDEVIKGYQNIAITMGYSVDKTITIQEDEIMPTLVLMEILKENRINQCKEIKRQIAKLCLEIATEER